jgi:hypothetical protein
MSFSIKRVGHLVLRAKDMQRSRRFFEQVLGLLVVAETIAARCFSARTLKTTITCWRSCRRAVTSNPLYSSTS